MISTTTDLWHKNTRSLMSRHSVAMCLHGECNFKIDVCAYDSIKEGLCSPAS